jgi:segregation and condensation protein A
MLIDTNCFEFMYELRIGNFSGPIEKLLELIEEKKLEITELSLAEVTADFLRYIQTLTDAGSTQTDAEVNKAQTNAENNIRTQTNADDTQTNAEINQAQTNAESDVCVSPRSVCVSPRLLADFIVIASQLLLIKSKSLLPNLRLTEEEEKDIKDLQYRLRFYQQFKPAMTYFKKLWEQNNSSYARPLFSNLFNPKQSQSIFFYPAENIKIEELYKAINKIFENIKEVLESEVIKTSLISLEEKIEEILKRLSADSRGLNADSHRKYADLNGKVNFDELMDGKTRSEIVVLFLAVLHLLANQLIRVEQKQKFESIIIEKK